MKQNRIVKGTLPPLFDRIITDRTGQGLESKLLSAQELKESIIREVSTVLNTRCTVRKAIYKDHIDNIPLFGMPDFFGLDDFSYFDASNSDDWPEASRYIATAILAAEPRLKNVKVTVDIYDPVNQALTVTVSGSLKDDKLFKDIHFPLTLLSLSPARNKTAA